MKCKPQSTEETGIVSDIPIVHQTAMKILNGVLASQAARVLRELLPRSGTLFASLALVETNCVELVKALITTTFIPVIQLGEISETRVSSQGAVPCTSSAPLPRTS